MFFCECENFFVAFWHSVQVTLVESSQISASGRHMQALLVCEQGYLYEQFGIIIEITVKKAGNRNHRAIGSVLFFLLRWSQKDPLSAGRPYSGGVCRGFPGRPADGWFWGQGQLSFHPEGLSGFRRSGSLYNPVWLG